MKKPCFCFLKNPILTAPTNRIGLTTTGSGIYIALFHTAIVYGLAQVLTHFLRHVLVSLEASMSDSSFAYLVRYIPFAILFGRAMVRQGWREFRS